MAETVTARDANQHFSRLLRQVAEGKSFVITHRGRSVARLVPEPAPDGAKRLTPEQEQALAESIAWSRSLPPPAEPTNLPADWPRDRDELYDLVNDPWELENTIDDPARRDVVADMRLRMADWSIQTEDARPVPLPGCGNR